VADEEAREELTAEQLIEHIRQIKVGDLLVSTLATLSQLGYAKLERSSRDLQEARLAIESLRALLPVLKDAVPEQTVRDFQQVVANLQLAYATAADEDEKPADEEQSRGDAASAHPDSDVSA
jgi:hypothetical protein